MRQFGMYGAELRGVYCNINMVYTFVFTGQPQSWRKLIILFPSLSRNTWKNSLKAPVWNHPKNASFFSEHFYHFWQEIWLYLVRSVFGHPARWTDSSFWNSNETCKNIDNVTFSDYRSTYGLQNVSSHGRRERRMDRLYQVGERIFCNLISVQPTENNFQRKFYFEIQVSIRKRLSTKILFWNSNSNKIIIWRF